MDPYGEKNSVSAANDEHLNAAEPSESGLATRFVHDGFPAGAALGDAARDHYPRRNGGSPELTAAKIVVIDDDDAVRDSVQALLESYGHEVSGYASAEDFLARARDGADCLLVDHHMPGMLGLDLLEHLHAQGHRTPALMITGRAEPTMKQRANRIGVKFLEKPIADEQLILAIKEACNAAPS